MGLRAWLLGDVEKAEEPHPDWYAGRPKFAVGTRVAYGYDLRSIPRTVTAVEFTAPLRGAPLNTMGVWIVTDAPPDSPAHADVWYHFTVLDGVPDADER